jgi:hypothetical protein
MGEHNSAALGGYRLPGSRIGLRRRRLNERGVRTATGKDWTAVQATRVRERLGLA